MIDVLTRIGQEQRATLLVVTHEENVALIAARRIEMRDGKIVASHC
ncbi:MAG: hypothetical protein ACXWBM_06775 [Chthoniobacterales bacterium]